MPRPAKNLKLEQRIEIARRFAAGESSKHLADAFGISSRHVTRLAKEEAGEGVAVRDPSETVAFRATQSELEAFDAEWQARGFANRSQALKAVLRGRCGFLDVPRDLIAEFCATWRQSKDVSDAGLGLAKAVHRGKLEVSPEDRVVLIDLVDLVQVMSRELGRMKDAAQVQRRQDWSEQDGETERERADVEEKAVGLGSDQNALRRSDLELNPQSLPLGKPRMRSGMSPNFVASRNTRHG